MNRNSKWIRVISLVLVVMTVVMSPLSVLAERGDRYDRGDERPPFSTSESDSKEEEKRPQQRPEPEKKPEEERRPDKEEKKTQKVTIEYYNEKDKKIDSAKVTVDGDDKKISKDLVKKHMPKGYEYVGHSSIHSGVVKASVKAIPQTKQITIEYYNEQTKKSVGSETVTVDKYDKEISKELVKRHMPKGYEYVGHTAIRSGVVKVGVKAQTKEITIEYYNEQTKKKITSVKVAVGKYDKEISKELATKHMPKGYEYVGRTSIHSGVVQVGVKAQTKQITIEYYNEQTKKSVGSAKVTVGKYDKEISKELAQKYMPKGYAYVGHTAIRSDVVKVGVKVQTKEITVEYYDEKHQKIASAKVTVSKDAKEISKELAMKNMPKGYRYAGHSSIYAGTVRVSLRKAGR